MDCPRPPEAPVWFTNHNPPMVISRTHKCIYGCFDGAERKDGKTFEALKGSSSPKFPTVLITRVRVSSQLEDDYANGERKCLHQHTPKHAVG